MIKHYIKVALRNLAKQRYYTSINIIGLAFGIAASALIFLWINHETSYDKFHENYKNIYRVTTEASLGGQRFEVCLVPSLFAETFTEVCPEVEKTARITRYFDLVFKYKDNNFKEKKVIMADTSLFQLFHFKFLEGNPEKPFNSRESIILTESVAKKYFGNESALGKVLIVNNQNAVIVSAVIKDIPSNSHMKFNAALYFDVRDTWDNFNWLTYVMFHDGFSKANVKNSLREIVDNNILPEMSGYFGITVEQFKNAGNYIHLDMQSLKSIHLNSNYYGELEANGNKTYVMFFSIIALFILFIAGINYMNLSTAYYDTRVLEVGIRKANGATPGILVRQFLSESILISIAAFIIGIGIIEAALPLFTRFLDIEINEGMSKSWHFVLSLFALILVLGLISGIYPAAYLSRFKTTSILRHKLKSSGKPSLTIRSALVVTQFTITIVVIIATILVKKQVNFMLNKELGFTKEQLVVIEGANNLGDQKETFKNELLQNPQIINVSYSDTYPGENYNNITGYGLQGDGPDVQYVLKTISVSTDYFDTYEMDLIYGRKFYPTDRSAVILNENAMKLMKIENNPLNHHILSNDEPLLVVGVVKNFHHDALNITLDPMLIRLADIRFLNNINVRLAKGNAKEAMSYIHKKWDTISNNLPFEYYFLDEKLRSAYNAEMKAGKVFTVFSILSIVIACMGILGIASFLLQRRIKEIGIRKVNGAKITEILALLNKDYIKWVAVSFIIATPAAYYLMNKWLNNFAFKTEMNWWIFALAGLLVLSIALLTVSWHSWRAATRNPVEALRYE